MAGRSTRGSAFKRVIIPVVPSKLLDRTMLYTAITRPVAVLVGEADHMKSSPLPHGGLNDTTPLTSNREPRATRCSKPARNRY